MRAGWIGAFMLVAGQADAGLTLCNDREERASVAIAYATDDVWTSEGWWGIEPGACAVVQSGDLKQRHYYYTLSGDDGFAGEGYSFCTQPQAFTLTGADGDCAALAAESRAFSHIDTGADAIDFTVRLGTASPKQDTPLPPPSAPESVFDNIPDHAEDVANELAAAAIPSFVQGQMGEPFTVTGIVQGCGPTEGGNGCTFYAEGARWIAYNGAASNPAALGAMAAMPVGAAVLVTGDLISFGDITAEAAIASLQPGDDPYASQRTAMQGVWVSVDDPQSRLEITGSEQTDIYGGEVLGVSVLTLSDFCGGQNGGVLLGVQQMGGDPADTQCFDVLTAEPDRLELSYIGRGNTLAYVRP